MCSVLLPPQQKKRGWNGDGDGEEFMPYRVLSAAGSRFEHPLLRVVGLESLQTVGEAEGGQLLGKGEEAKGRGRRWKRKLVPLEVDPTVVYPAVWTPGAGEEWGKLPALKRGGVPGTPGTPCLPGLGVVLRRIGLEKGGVTAGESVGLLTVVEEAYGAEASQDETSEKTREGEASAGGTSEEGETREGEASAGGTSEEEETSEEKETSEEGVEWRTVHWDRSPKDGRIMQVEVSPMSLP
jgi:hypothetical protein